MAEYTWDPSTNSGVEVSQFNNTSDGNETNYQQNADIAAEINRRDTASFLASRHENVGHVGSTDGDQELLSLQRQLSEAADAGNGVLVESLVAKVDALALQLTTGQKQAPQQQQQQLPTDDQPSIDDNYDQHAWVQEARDRYDDLDGNLQYAADTFSKSTNEEINEIFQGTDNLEAKQTALNLIDQARKSGGKGFSQEISSFSQTDISSITEVVGEQTAYDIATINEALVRGVTSPGQVIKDISKNPELLRSVITLAQQGLINIHI